MPNNKDEIRKQLADLKGRAQHFHELDNETCWDDDIARLEALLSPKPKAKAGGANKTEDLDNGS